MHLRPLGQTGLNISEIGFGAWGIGGVQWLGSDDQESLKALHTAVDQGVNIIDTALAYGEGHSERLVGKLLRERSGVYVATKIPPRNDVWPANDKTPVAECYPPEHIVTSCEQSLKNLGTSHIDLLQLHTWHDAYLDQGGWRDALESLKHSGKVRLLGASVSEHAPETALKAAKAGVFDCLQVLYNIFDPRAADELLPLCQSHGIGVLIRVPFDEGGLTGTIKPETVFANGDFRKRYFEGERRREVFERAESLKQLLGSEAASLSELALRFCLSHDATSTVIPGMRRVPNVGSNTSVSDGRRLSPDLLGRLRKHAWPRNYWH